MMLVEQIAAYMSSKSNGTIRSNSTSGDVESLVHSSGQTRKRNQPVNWTTTLGLVVHAAADGIALGAAATTNQTDVEMIVFLAIMLHKAPASFGLVTYLLHEGLDKPRIKRHLLVFSLAAPILAIVTYLLLPLHGQV